jgi:hypothetical protein
MCAVRISPVVFAVNENLTTPRRIGPIVSHDSSLVGACTPESLCVAGKTGASSSDPALAPSDLPAESTKPIVASSSISLSP